MVVCTSIHMAVCKDDFAWHTHSINIVQSKAPITTFAKGVKFVVLGQYHSVKLAGNDILKVAFFEKLDFLWHN